MKESWIIVYLSISLLLCQWRWILAEKRISYLEGRLAVYQEDAAWPEPPVYDSKPYDPREWSVTTSDPTPKGDNIHGLSKLSKKKRHT